MGHCPQPGQIIRHYELERARLGIQNCCVKKNDMTRLLGGNLADKILWNGMRQYADGPSKIAQLSCDKYTKTIVAVKFIPYPDNHGLLGTVQRLAKGFLEIHESLHYGRIAFQVRKLIFGGHFNRVLGAGFLALRAEHALVQVENRALLAVDSFHDARKRGAILRADAAAYAFVHVEFHLATVSWLGR
jgi:hypothetical protein